MFECESPRARFARKDKLIAAAAAVAVAVAWFGLAYYTTYAHLSFRCVRSCGEQLFQPGHRVYSA